jgi:hypothetical protein
MDNTTYVDSPVPSCPANYAKRATMRHHFHHRHYSDTIIIDEEGALPQCQLCLFFCQIANTNRHRNSKTCRDGILRMQRHNQQQQSEMAEQTTITINDIEIQNVDTFKYLGRYISATSTDTVAINYNLRKARKTWGRISIILKREGATKKTMGNFYKAVVQSVLLYASETWQPTELDLKPLNVFHHKVARHITNRHIRKYPNSEVWFYPNMEIVMEEANLLPITQYIQKRKQTLLNWTQNRPIYQHARRVEEVYRTSLWGPDNNP